MFILNQNHQNQLRTTMPDIKMALQKVLNANASTKATKRPVLVKGVKVSTKRVPLNSLGRPVKKTALKQKRTPTRTEIISKT